jgi:hypothetical protein
MLQRQLPVNFPPDPGRLAVTDGYFFNGGFLTCLIAHEFLRQSLGQRQRLVLDLAFRQCLLELLYAFVGYDPTDHSGSNPSSLAFAKPASALSYSPLFR